MQSSLLQFGDRPRFDFFEMSLRLHVSVNSPHISTAVHLETYQQQGLSPIFRDQMFTIYEFSRGLRPASRGKQPLIGEKMYVQEICYLPSLKLTAKAPENGGPFEKEIPIGNHHFQGLSGFQVPTQKTLLKQTIPQLPPVSSASDHTDRTTNSLLKSWTKRPRCLGRSVKHRHICASSYT